MDIGTACSTSSFAGRIGVARRDITPPVGIRARNWGPASWDEAEGVHRPLTLTAVVISSGVQSEARDSAGRAAVLLSLDGTWWRRVADEWFVRGEVLRRLALSPAQLLLSLSHTHAGAVLCADEKDLPGGRLIEGYLSQIVDEAVSAVGEAEASLLNARVEWTTGLCNLATNREAIIAGKPYVGFNPRTVADDTVLVGRVTTPSGATLATLVNYACHPTTLAWENRLISPDYVGAMREVVEAATHAPCAFFQGASGELAPRHQYVGDVEVADKHGAVLGHAVLSALAGMPAPGAQTTLTDTVESGAPLALWADQASDPSTELTCRNGFVELDVVDLPSLDELARRWEGIEPRSRDERLRRARNLREGYIDGKTVQHPLWVWRVGSALIVAHPGEAYSQLQCELREVFPAHHVMVINLTNGPGFVYLPTSDAYEAGAYQAWQTPLAPGSLDRLVERAATLIRSVIEEEA